MNCKIMNIFRLTSTLQYKTKKKQKRKTDIDKKNLYKN